MKNHYKEISFADINNKDGIAWTKPDDGYGLLQQPVTYFFEEAGRYRRSMRAIADIRLRQIKRLDEIDDALSFFYEATPASALMQIIYRDFADYKPTVKQNIVNDLGVGARTAQNLIGNLVEARVLHSADYEGDRRTQILIPSVGFIAAYERRAIKSVQRRAVIDKRSSSMVKRCREFDELRRSFFKPEIFKLLSFQLDEHAAKLELVRD